MSLQFLNGVAVPPLTQGSVLFVGASGVVVQDNTSIFFDDTNNRLGLGTVTPKGVLHGVVSTGYATYSDIFGSTITTAYILNSSLASASFTSPFYATLSETTFDPPSDPGTRTVVGIRAELLIPATNSTTFASSSGTYQAGNWGFRHSGSGNVSGSATGLFCTAIHAGSGTFTSLHGGQSRLQNTGAGTVTNGYGFRIPAPSNSGVITNTYGLYIDSHTVGTQTNTPYAIWQDGSSDINYFKGKLYQSVGSANPALVPAQFTPQMIALSSMGEYAVDTATAFNIFQIAGHVTNSGTANSVGVFGGGSATGANSAVWGGNFVAYINHSQASLAYGIEVDYGTNYAGRTATGICINSVGSANAQSAIQISSLNWANQPANCIDFYYNPVGLGTPPDQNITPATNSLLHAFGGAAGQCFVPKGIDFSATAFTTAAILTGNGSVGINCTPAYSLDIQGGGLRVRQLPTPSAPTITPQGTAGSTTYTYWVIAEDRHGNRTIDNVSGGSTSTGNATLSTANWNKVTWSASTGANKYYILKKATAPTSGGTETILLDIWDVSHVQAITIGYAGTGMSAAPTVTFVSNGDAGTGAAATVNMSGSAPNQTVRDVVVTAGGSGYSSGPIVLFTIGGVQGPKATSYLLSGAVNSITLIWYGANWTSVPTVGFSGGGGSGATATITMQLDSTNTVLAGGGTGYTANDLLTVSGGTSTSAATIRVDTVSAGVIQTWHIIGTGTYTVLPSNPASVTGGTGSGATFTLKWKGRSVAVTAGGSGYSSTPIVTFASGSTTFPVATASHTALEVDDYGQSLTSFVSPTRNATGDLTVDGHAIVGASLSDGVTAVNTRPTGDRVVPANYVAYIFGFPYRISSGRLVTIEAEAILRIDR